MAKVIGESIIIEKGDAEELAKRFAPFVVLFDTSRNIYVGFDIGRECSDSEHVCRCVIDRVPSGWAFHAPITLANEVAVARITRHNDLTAYYRVSVVPLARRFYYINSVSVSISRLPSLKTECRIWCTAHSNLSNAQIYEHEEKGIKFSVLYGYHMRRVSARSECDVDGVRITIHDLTKFISEAVKKVPKIDLDCVVSLCSLALLYP